MEQEKYNVVSIFSGGMGLDIGLEQTGRFRVLACVEKQPAFCETIEVNKRAGRMHAEPHIFCRPIEDLDPLDVLRTIGLEPGKVDLLVGGPSTSPDRPPSRQGRASAHP